ncbi:hypothetical protein COV11_03250 [Candidatus Woesearchaeota archaeon CG10_big_fil_rev_8_21_14_0_10_30_7]|nr:MAG: hypothetical protein COV11_03250 [Candidatus Woesearchaeota archaeon CG10_big_fil_rev_8_21_14_0_10_30_7]
MLKSHFLIDKSLKSAVIIILLLSLMSFAYAKGCCCDQTTNIPNPNHDVPDKNSCSPNTNFVSLTLKDIITGTTCDTKCGTPVVGPGPGVISQCSPAYNPPAKNLKVNPVQGEKKFNLDFDVECPSFVSELIIERCKGDKSCTKFDKINTISPTSHYVDEDSKLIFQTEYTYKILLKYKSNKDVYSELTTSNLGDLECYQQQANIDFCINSRYYKQYKEYLKKEGYKNAPAKDFDVNDKKFDDNIKHYWSANLEKSGKCGANNKLTLPTIADCKLNELCQVQNNNPTCVLATECDKINSGPLGLFTKIEVCEGTSNNPKTCYLDKTNNVVDKCLNCNQALSCFDYKSKSACQKNNCGLPNCEWHDVISELGVGVCVDSLTNNCDDCDKKTGVFDVCSEEKSNALSTMNYACFFSAGKSFSCDNSKCSDYSKAQCDSQQIQLDNNNELISKSSDTCKIGVCQFNTQTNACYKNSDGDSNSDCGPNDSACEKDYFPPSTEIYASNVQGPSSKLNIRIKDKEYATDILSVKTNSIFEIFVCVITSTNNCADAKTFMKIDYNKNYLTVEGLELLDVKDQKTVNKISDLIEGINKIKFYSKDKNNNLEIVKEYEFTACTNCLGAGIAKYYVKDANKYDEVFYTKSKIPTIIIELLNPAKATIQQLKDASGKQLLATPAPITLQDKFEFQPGQLLSEGKYTFIFDAESSNGLPLDKPIKIEFWVDTTLPILKITPADGELIDKPKTSINLEFNEKSNVTLAKIIEENFVNIFVKKMNVIQFEKDLKSTKDEKFDYSIDNSFDGRKTLVIEAEDYAGNQITGQVKFFTVSKGGKISVINPSWGVAPNENFDLTILTNIPSQCGYLFDLPSIPVIDQQTLDASIPFLTTDKHEHKSLFTQIKTGDLTEHTIDLICKGSKDFFHERINVRVDLSKPEIKNAFARPKIVQETITSTSNKYQTMFVVELDEEGFCKYDPFRSDFNTMTGLFKGFDEEPKKILETEINVTLIGDHEFNIGCKNKAELLSAKELIKFKVDPTAKYYVESLTNKVFNELKAKLRIYSSKKALCYYGEKLGEETTQFSQGSITHYHNAEVTLPATSIGELNYFVKCQTPTGETASTTINFFIDPTPPTITLDASTDYVISNISWKNDSVKIKLGGDDVESGISHFNYMVQDNATKEVLIDWNITRSNESFYVSTKKIMRDGTKYVVLAKSVNKAGLESEIVQSKIILVNSTLTPGPCFNKEKDIDELDVDCGSVCSKKCSVNQNCNENNDCSSLICISKKCGAPSCTDQVLSPGFETSIGCGGQCPKCSIGKTCDASTDCVSGNCNNGVCREEDLCDNDKLDIETGETGIDCGGNCDTCILDEDEDGIPDNEENKGCENTLKGEQPFKRSPYNGCSEDQAYALWSKQIPQSARSKSIDADNDGLTNLEEFREGTNPINLDTDGDGWNDGVEVDKGTDPNDASDHPTSIVWTLLKILIILAALGGLGYAGYYFYQKYEGKLPQGLIEKFPWLQKVPGVEAPTITRFKKKIFIPPKTHDMPRQTISGLKKIAREKPEYIPLKSLRKHTGKEEVFEKLKKFGKKKEKNKRTDPEVFEKLKKIKKKNELGK